MKSYFDGQRSEERPLTSIVSYPERGEGGCNRYRGNCSPKLVEDLIRFFRPEMICDYMCGSGTTKAAADNMGIQSRNYDLHSGFDLLNCEIPERPEFIFWHPPYWNIITYSDRMYPAKAVEERFGFDPRKYDLSRIPDWNRFVQGMNAAMMRQYSALEKGGRIAVLMGDIKKKGQLYSMLSEISKPGTLENIIIKLQHNCFSDSKAYSGKFIPILHEYVMIVKKESALIVPMLVTGRAETDIRDMGESTWRDVVAAVMEPCREAVTLSYLYEQIENHRKAKENMWWKEKIRQTLQCYPHQFEHMGRGMWGLRRKAG